MAVSFEPMVRFGSNFARIIIFQFYCHLKGKAEAVKSKDEDIMPSWDLGHIVNLAIPIMPFVQLKSTPPMLLRTIKSLGASLLTSQ